MKKILSFAACSVLVLSAASAIAAPHNGDRTSCVNQFRLALTTGSSNKATSVDNKPLWLSLTNQKQSKASPAAIKSGPQYKQVCLNNGKYTARVQRGKTNTMSGSDIGTITIHDSLATSVSSSSASQYSISVNGNSIKVHAKDKAGPVK